MIQVPSIEVLRGRRIVSAKNKVCDGLRKPRKSTLSNVCLSALPIFVVLLRFRCFAIAYNEEEGKADKKDVRENAEGFVRHRFLIGGEFHGVKGNPKPLNN